MKRNAWIHVTGFLMFLWCGLAVGAEGGDDVRIIADPEAVWNLEKSPFGAFRAPSITVKSGDCAYRMLYTPNNELDHVVIIYSVTGKNSHPEDIIYIDHLAALTFPDRQVPLGVADLLNDGKMFVLPFTRKRDAIMGQYPDVIACRARLRSGEWVDIVFPMEKFMHWKLEYADKDEPALLGKLIIRSIDMRDKPMIRKILNARTGSATAVGDVLMTTLLDKVDKSLSNEGSPTARRELMEIREILSRHDMYDVAFRNMSAHPVTLDLIYSDRFYDLQEAGWYTLAPGEAKIITRSPSPTLSVSYEKQGQEHTKTVAIPDTYKGRGTWYIPID